jgi:hypothetical protein
MAWIAAGWLACHMVALAAPLAAAAIAAAQDLCTCPGGTPGAMCPMHHRAMSMSTDTSPATPHVKDACAQADLTLLSFAGGLGVLPAPTVLAGDAAQSDAATSETSTVFRAEPPDAPPPRV